MSYAAVKDYEQRLPIINGERASLTSDERSKAKTLLEDAAALIASEFKRLRKEINLEDEVLVHNLKTVSINMVQRKMSNDDAIDYSQRSMTAGSFTESYTFANPSGDLYLTSQERKALGLFASARIGLTANYTVLDEIDELLEPYPEGDGDV